MHISGRYNLSPGWKNELDPCRYEVIEKHRNVTVEVLRCKKCGHVEIAWTRQENTEDDDETDIRAERRGNMIMYKPRSTNRNATYKCSVCGKLCSSYYNDVGEWKHCPHCGAKMDLEDEIK